MVHARLKAKNKQKSLRRHKKTIVKLRTAGRTLSKARKAADQIMHVAKQLPKDRWVKIALVRKGTKSVGKGGDNRHFEKKALYQGVNQDRVQT